MSHEQPTPENLIEACLEASFYFSARDPGMTWQELVDILVALGVPKGEANDAIRAGTRRNDLSSLPSGRLFYVRDEHLKVAVFDFLLPFEDDPRDRKAIEHLHRWIKAKAQEKGTSNTRIGRSEVLAEAAAHHFRTRDVDFTLEVMTRLHLIDREDDGEMYRTKEALRTWGIIGAHTDRRVSVMPRPAFSKVLPLVEQAILARFPEAKRKVMLGDLAHIEFVQPEGEDARLVLRWIVSRFADTGAPVPLEEVYLALPPEVDAKSIAWRLASGVEYLRIDNQVTNPTATPTVWAAASSRELFVDAFILLDGGLQRARDLRMQSKNRAALIGSGGLLDVQGTSKKMVEIGIRLAASLRPYLATGQDVNALVEIHDDIRKFDRLAKFLAWKAQTAGRTAASSPAPRSEGESTMSMPPVSQTSSTDSLSKARESDTSPPAPSAIDTDSGGLMTPLAPLDRFDVAIVCALYAPELNKVRETGQESWTDFPPSRSDPHSYVQTTFKSKQGAAIRVIAAAPNLMGLSASSVLATKMIMRFRPRLVAMVGIAAGTKSDKQGYGDILAAEHTFDYGSGKIEETKEGTRLLPDHKPLDVDSRVLSRLRRWAADRKELDAMRQSWPAKKPQTVLEIHIGPLGSGAAVVAGGATIAAVMEHWRKLIGIEMEAYGVHRACRDTIKPEPLFLCLKSICDFASAKNDDWQDYAAFVSARFLHEFLTTDWEELFPD